MDGGWDSFPWRWIQHFNKASKSTPFVLSFAKKATNCGREIGKSLALLVPFVSLAPLPPVACHHLLSCPKRRRDTDETDQDPSR